MASSIPKDTHRSSSDTYNSMPNAAFAATTEDVNPSVHPSAGPPHGFPSSPVTHHTQGTHSWCSLVAPNKKRRTNISGIDAPHTNSASNSRVSTPMSTFRIEPNMVDQAVGVRIFPYKDYTIGIPEDLSSSLSALQKYQESAIDANAVYDVTKLTYVLFGGVRAGNCLFWFNSPPTRRENISSGLYILSFVEKSNLVVAGVALASCHEYQAMEMGHQEVSLPGNISELQRELLSKFTTLAPRLLQPSRSAPELTLRSQALLRSFPTDVYWGGLAVTVCPKFLWSSRIQLPQAAMSLWDLVEYLTSPINGDNGHDITEERAALRNISEWAASISRHLDAGNIQRQIFLVSLIGKQVELKSGVCIRLGGMRGGEFVVQYREGGVNNEVVQMDEIVGEHVELASRHALM